MKISFKKLLGYVILGVLAAAVLGFVVYVLVILGVFWQAAEVMAGILAFCFMFFLGLKLIED